MSRRMRVARPINSRVRQALTTSGQDLLADASVERRVAVRVALILYRPDCTGGARLQGGSQREGEDPQSENEQ